jgi:hypothetical protein
MLPSPPSYIYSNTGLILCMDKDDKQFYVPKKLLGELVRILITSTDPANILVFTSATIGASRAIMIKMLENQIPNPDIINTALQALLLRTAEAWTTHHKITPEEAVEIEKILMDVFKSEPLMKYDLQLYRDILYCEDLYNLWFDANSQYIIDKSSWYQSNASIATINKTLYEIIIRHNLMSLPYGDGFNLDQHGTDTSQVQQLLASLARASGGDD